MRGAMLDRHISWIVLLLSRPSAFLITCFVVAAGGCAGVALSFNDRWALAFNLLISIAALLFSALILVAGAKDTAALQLKMDELLRVSEDADDRLIGLDKGSVRDVERARDESLGMRAASLGGQDADRPGR